MRRAMWFSCLCTLILHRPCTASSLPAACAVDTCAIFDVLHRHVGAQIRAAKKQAKAENLAVPAEDRLPLPHPAARMNYKTPLAPPVRSSGTDDAEGADGGAAASSHALREFLDSIAPQPRYGGSDSEEGGEGEEEGGEGEADNDI